MTVEFEELQRRLAEGVLAFPATAFHPDGSLDLAGHEAHVSFLAQNDPRALVAAGGAGEVFSLSMAEHEQVIRATVQSSYGIPVIGGAGYGTAMACEMARAVERAGADAVLLLPPYLVRSEPEGMHRHIRVVCSSVSIAVIPYSRDNGVVAPDTLLQLAEECPNLIGVKDGTGDVSGLLSLKQRAGNRLTLINGAPTAEVLAPQFRAAGVNSYSSAVFTFLPAVAKRFYHALVGGEEDVMAAMLRDFYLPLVALRDRKRGYSVSIVKAGLRVVGMPAGPVRPPLLDLDAQEEATLATLVARTKQWAP